MMCAKPSTSACRRARRCAGLLASLGLTLSAVADPRPAPRQERLLWRPSGRIDPVVLTEISGVVASRQHPGVFWVHADSGNQPKLVAIDSNGARLAEVMLAGAPNIDWEDLAADDKGNLYIGDLGNNTGMLPVRYLYAVAEPDPAHPPTTPVAPQRRWRVRYPDGDRFNIESLFWRGGSLFIVPRGSRQGGVVHRLVPHGEDDLVMEPVSPATMPDAAAADVSTDGATLLVCGLGRAELYRLSDAPDLLAGGERRAVTFPPVNTIEACCLTDHDAVLIPENGQVYHVPLARFDENARFRAR